MSIISNENQERNPRGIPKAPFIADVAEFLGADPNPEAALKDFQAALAYSSPSSSAHVQRRKYRYMDQNLTQRRQTLEEKIPEIKKTLSMVEFLQERRDGKSASTEGDLEDDDLEDDDDSASAKALTTTFELNDTLYAEATLEDTDTVYLWLGRTRLRSHRVHAQANVMLSYKLPAAISLLRSKLGAAEKSLSTVVEDLDFLREQITVMEVNTARVYNWDVKRRRELREREAKAGQAKEG
ncbi:Prefoldin subunit 3 [Daedaleopsis nitida]|nr:Prefoldin subunit 3 [Daedaleopsis nitida]